jgi:uncharacterized glyoxalase superfamily protein PhnB
MQNRSLPPGGVVPFLKYPDVPRAIEWLCGAFGFKERLRTPPDPDGSIHLAQVIAGEGSIMLRTGKPAAPGQSFLVRVDDADAHCARAQQFGAQVKGAPKSTEFGERQYTAIDPEGYQWTFSQSIADVDPKSWGAIVG